MDRATVELDPKKRAAVYQEFQKLVVEAAPLVWVHELQFVTVYNKQFKDLIVSPLGLYASFDRAYQDSARIDPANCRHQLGLVPTVLSQARSPWTRRGSAP